MKYLAILKDSFREAIDSKAIYVMMALSVLVILFVLTMSFTPGRAEPMMQALVQGRGLEMVGGGRHDHEFDAEMNEEGRMMRGFFTVVGVEAVKGSMDSPSSEYRVTVRFSPFEEGIPAPQPHPGVGDGKPQPPRDEQDLNRRRREQGLKLLERRLRRAEDLGLIKIVEVRTARADNPHLPKHDFDLQRGTVYEFHTQPTSQTIRLWPHELSLFLGALPLGGNMPLGAQLFLIALMTVQIGSWVTIIVSIILTAFFIPNMLRKGTVDLLLVKPIHRWALLLYKYIGGLTFIFLNTLVAIVGMWMALGLRSGVWANYFLLMIPLLTFFFAILYAVSTLFGVMTRSAIVAILATCGAWFVFFIIGTLYNVFDQRYHQEERAKIPETNRWSDSTFARVVKGVHFVTPRTGDLNTVGQQMLAADFITGNLEDANKILPSSVHWAESVTVSLVFIALTMALSCWWFATRDY
jgi:ABC-type transport system involved in multi-copper enzyme maturation permease subunit